MAYRNIVAQACVDKEEAFQRIRDFICKRNGTYDYSTDGIGWTLFDSVYATDEDNCAINDYFVIYSPGESGGEDLYFRIKWTNSYMQIHGFLSWDPATHAGSAINYATGSNFYIAEADTPQLYVYGSLDALCIMNKRAVDDYSPVLFGRCGKPYEDMSAETVTCASALTAGSDVSITVDSMPSNWAVGKEIYIRTTHTDNMATTYIEKIIIKTLSSLTITADLVNPYAADSALTDHIGYICQDVSAVWSTTRTLIDPAGVADNQSTNWVYASGIAPTYHDPAAYEDRIGLYNVYLQTTVGVLGIFPNVKRTPVQNAEFTNEDILAEDDGTEWRCLKIRNNIPLAFKEV